MRLLRALCAFLALATATAAQEAPYYELEVLNEGLGEAPDFIDRSTPRAAMESLLFAAATERWEQAAHLLNLNEYAPERQPEVGARLVQRLETVIDRKAVIDWDKLLDRPDGLDAESSDRSAVAGKPRKSILVWSLELADRPASIRLNRVRAGDAEPVWVFAAQTVENIDPLYVRHGPSWLEETFPRALREKAAGGLMLWELLGLPLVLTAAALAGWLVKVVLDWFAARAKTRLLRDILRAVRGPAIFGTVVAILSYATTQLFVFSGRIDAVLQPMIVLGVVGSLLWLVVNAIDAVLNRLVTFQTDELSRREMQAQKSTATKVAAGRRALIVVFAALAIGVALSSTSIFRNFGWSLIGTAGALTLVLGFAARRVLGNIMSSLQIALNQSARIGDRIVYKDHLCHVERINFTFVQLRDWVGTRLVVPVEEFASNTFENWTMQEPDMVRVIKIRTAHDADVDRLRSAFDAVIAELDENELGDLDDAMVRVAEQDVFGMEVWFCLPCADPNTSWDMACQAREKIIAKAAEIERQDEVRIFPEVPAADAA